MKTIKISQQSKLLSYLLTQARQENLILQSADGEAFVLAKIGDASEVDFEEEMNIQAFDVGETDDFEAEIILTRQNSLLMNFLDRRAAKVQPGAGKSLEEIRQGLDT